MAIIQGVSGIKVTIRINDVDCVEYDDPEVSEHQPLNPTTTKYIESPDDAEFAINVKVDGTYDWSYENHHLIAVITADGTLLRKARINKDDLNEKGELKIEEGVGMFCKETGSWNTYKFKFSTVNTIEDATKERIKRDKKTAEKLGLVEIRLHRATDLGEVTMRSKHRPPKTSVDLAEKSMKGKAISHGTVFCNPTRIPVPTSYTANYLDGKSPIAVFLFRYRSKMALQHELIIPATPPRLPDLDGLSEAEVRRLAAERLMDIHEERLVKEERGATVKREYGEIQDLTEDDRPNKIRRVHSEVVDLTGE